MQEAGHDPGAGDGRATGWALPIGGGVAAGVIAGLFGVGGGILLVPLLVLVMHRAQHEAHATSLVAVTLGALAGVARFAADGSVALVGGAALAVGAVAGARLGSWLLPFIPERRLRQVFIAVLVVLSVRFLVVGASGEAATAGDVVPELDALRIALHVGGGVVAGVVSSVLGVGGGIVNVPLLVLGFGYGQHVAEGTSLAVIVPTALTGAVSHHRHAYTDWRLGRRLGIGTVVGAVIGAQVALSLSPVTLGRLYGILQIVVAVLMVRRRRPPADLDPAPVSAP